MKIIILTTVALLIPTTVALAEQRQTFKDASGRTLGRSVSDARGNTNYYDSLGRTTGRSVTSGGTTTVHATWVGRRARSRRADDEGQDSELAAAVHESGHAVAVVTAFRTAKWLPRSAPPLPVRYVEITENGSGHCAAMNIYSATWDISVIAPRYRPLMEAQVCIHLAGGIAEGSIRACDVGVRHCGSRRITAEAIWSGSLPYWAISSG